VTCGGPVKDGREPNPRPLKRQARRITKAKLTVAEQQLLELMVYDSELQEKVLPILEEHRLRASGVGTALPGFHST
jgi:hypothetical protein